MGLRAPHKGISLLETILATFLVGLFLIVLSDLTSSLSKISDQANTRESISQILGPVFTLMRADFSQAVKVNRPSGLANSSPSIELQRLKPEALVPTSAARARLPLTLPSANGYAWNPAGPTYLEEVGYELVGTSLRRRVGTWAGSVLAEIQSLRASQPEQGLFEIAVEIEIGSKREVLKCLVER